MPARDPGLVQSEICEDVAQHQRTTEFGARPESTHIGTKDCLSSAKAPKYSFDGWSEQQPEVRELLWVAEDDQEDNVAHGERKDVDGHGTLPPDAIGQRAPVLRGEDAEDAHDDLKHERECGEAAVDDGRVAALLGRQEEQNWASERV